MVPETTNDNSNPQQGNSSQHPVNVVKNDPHSEVLSPAPAPTRRLKIPPNERDSRKLFVGGLPQDITNDVFVEFFSQFGELLDCVVMFDRETGRSRGFGFVTYVDHEVSVRLLSMGDSEDKNVGRLRMGDKLVEVKAAQPKPGEIRRSFQKAGMVKPTMPGSAPGNHFHATASMESTRPVNFYAPDGTVVQPIQSYYPSYDANGAYMPGIYGSHPSHGVIQHGYHPPHHPAYFPPIGPAAVPMAHTPAGGVEMGHHHPGMVPYAAPVLPHQPIPAAATSIPSFEDPNGIPMRPLATAVPWNPPPQHQQPLFYVPVMSTPASATVIPPFVVPPPAQPPRAMPDVAINDSQQKQMFEEELEKKGQA